MKRKLLLSLFAILACVILVGCKKIEVSKNNSTLNDVYNKVGEYFGNEDIDRSNLGAYYIDNEKKLVIVVLVDNSEIKQEDFKKNVKVDSKYLKFVQGGPYSTFSND